MMNRYGGWGVGDWLPMSPIMLAVVALIIVGVVALTRRSNRSTTLRRLTGPQGPRPKAT